MRGILHNLGLKYKKLLDTNILFEHNYLISWHCQYLHLIKKFKSEKCTIVYIDKTWINEHDTISKTWCDTTTDINPYSVRLPGSGLSFGLEAKKGSGRRLIVVHAITEKSLINGALRLFQSGKPPSADYHDDRDAHNFEKWFREVLLPKLDKGTVIVMDNASYHLQK